MTHRRLLIATIMAGATLGAASGPALAADIIEAPVIDEVVPLGFYVRGDLGFSFNDGGDIEQIIEVCDFVTGNCVDQPFGFSDYDVDDTFLVGVGVGSHINDFLRWDVTADINFGGDITSGLRPDPLDATLDGVSLDGDFDAVTVLANIYADLGTYSGITPYIGAGLGFAYVNYGDVTQTSSQCIETATNFAIPCNPADPTQSIVGAEESFDGDSSARFAWALSAGVAYDINERIAIDGGYRFVRIEDGDLLEERRIEDDGINMHQIRIGARYKFN